MSYYLHLSSQDSKVSHPWNSAYDFTVEIPRPFYLDGSWECGLLDIEFPNDIDANTNIFLLRLDRRLVRQRYVSSRASNRIQQNQDAREENDFHDIRLSPLRNCEKRHVSASANIYKRRQPEAS